MYKWKTLIGKKLFSNNQVHVYGNYYYRWLTFGHGDLQTLIYLPKPNQPQLNYLKPLVLCAQQNQELTCLLGLGGGAITHMLKNNLDVIEYDAQIILLAQRFFMLKKLSSLNIIHINAIQYLQDTTQLYKNILVDLYDCTYPHDKLQSIDFFINCKAKLLPDGILAVNIVTMHEKILENMKKLFHIVIIPIKNTTNLVVLGYSGASINPLIEILSMSKLIKRITWDQRLGFLSFI